jgi:hypothetical protein
MTKRKRQIISGSLFDDERLYVKPKPNRGWIVNLPLLKVGDYEVEKTLVWIKHEDLSKLETDSEYQRPLLKWSNDLGAVLAAGGTFPSPIALATRGDDPTFRIVDGIQRTGAAKAQGIGLWAQVYRVNDADVEVRLFQILNTNKALSADLVVRASTGPIPELIRAANRDERSRLCGRIRLSSGRHNIGAFSLLKGMHGAMTGSENVQGRVQLAVAAVNALAKNDATQCRARAYLELVGHVWGSEAEPLKPEHRPPSIVFHAIGIVLGRRLNEGAHVGLPIGASLHSLRHTNWNREIPGNAAKFIPIAVDEISTRWKNGRAREAA